MIEIRYCIKCAHVFAPMHGRLQCLHPKSGQINPIDGNVYPEYTEYARSKTGACGPEGTLYEAANVRVA